MSEPIVQHDKDEKKVLRSTAVDVTKTDFENGYLGDVLLRMKKALSERDDGVALAAPQIGEPIKVFIVSGKIFDPSQSKTPIDDLVFINPKIIKLSKKLMEMEEGCLSVSNIYGKVKRSDSAVIEAQNEMGEKMTIEGTDLLSQIFQHECDHLNGILFIDKATDLHEPKNE